MSILEIFISNKPSVCVEIDFVFDFSIPSAPASDFSIPSAPAPVLKDLNQYYHLLN